MRLIFKFVGCDGTDGTYSLLVKVYFDQETAKRPLRTSGKTYASGIGGKRFISRAN